MRKLVLLLFCPFLGIAQDGYERQPDIDALSYAIEIELNDSNNRITAKSEIEFAMKAGIKSFFLDLSNEREGKGMLVQGVFWGDEALNFTHQNDRLTIEWNQQISQDGSVRVTVLYEGVPADGLIISKNKHGDRTFFGDNWPNRARNWFPCVDHPSDKAAVKFTVVAPSHYQVISNGEQVLLEKLDNDFTRTVYSTALVLPTKVMVIGVAKFSISKCENKGESTPSSAYVYPQEEEGGFNDYCSAVDILTWFENKIGPYPYEKLAHVQSKTRYGGMENAGCIFYHENSIDGTQGSRYLFAHEIAHQWFGNSASEKDWHHVWLSEGFATYLTEVYKQESAGEIAFKEGMEQARSRVVGFQKKYPNASIIDTNISNLNQLLSPMTYQKAAWMLHMLRNIVGEDAFWAGVKSYYNKYQFGNALSIDFQMEMETASNRDLSKFFQSWLYQPGMVDIEANYKYNERNKSLKVILKQAKTNWFVIPILFSWSSSVPVVMESYKMKITFENIEKPESGWQFDANDDILKW